MQKKHPKRKPQLRTWNDVLIFLVIWTITDQSTRQHVHQMAHAILHMLGQ